MLDVLISMVGGLFQKQAPASSPKSEKVWNTLFECQPFMMSNETGQVVKSWDLQLQVCGDEQRIKGREPDVDLLHHPCYTAVLKPWVEKEDFVILPHGGFYNFENETYYPTIQTYLEDRGQSMESMNMDELEALVDQLVNNKQPETELGRFALEYAQITQEQVDDAEEFVSNYFNRGTNDQSEPKR